MNEFLKKAMVEHSKTLPPVERYYSQIEQFVKREALEHQVVVTGNLLIDIDRIFQKDLITKKQHTLLIRATNVFNEYLNRSELSDAELPNVISHGMVALKEIGLEIQ
jgi:hypothetical protein